MKKQKGGRDRCGKNQAADERCTDLPLQTAVMFCPVLGTHKDTGTHTHAADKQNHHIHNRPCCPHCRQSIISNKPSYDHRIRRIVSKLK